MEKKQLPEPALCGETPDDYRKLDEDIDNVASSDNQLEHLDRSAASDLPAPEKLLSVSEGLTRISNDLLVESTPRGDEDGAGTKLTSGKKRSFTESTLTVHSLNSSDSFSMTRLKRTAESIPDDDDLLSSILGIEMELVYCLSLLLLLLFFMPLCGMTCQRSMDVFRNYLSKVCVLYTSAMDFLTRYYFLLLQLEENHRL